jgi:hypothetical protein
MPKPPIQGLDYAGVCQLFQAAGLAHSRSAVTREIAKHPDICSPQRHSYKTVRFDPAQVQAVITRITRNAVNLQAA